MKKLAKIIKAALLGKPFLAFGGVVILALSLGRIHLRVQTTLVGYEIGKLRAEETTLLEERAGLKMQLAKLTSKKHLELMTETPLSVATKAKSTVASK